MSASPDATILLEEGIEVLAHHMWENQPDPRRRLRCLKSWMGNAVLLARDTATPDARQETP